MKTETKIFTIKLPFLSEPVHVYLTLTKYANDNTAVWLSDAVTGEPTARLSTNVPDLFLPPDMFVCKNYSENEGMDIALEKAGIADRTGITVKTGFTRCPVMQLAAEIGRAMP